MRKKEKDIERTMDKEGAKIVVLSGTAQVTASSETGGVEVRTRYRQKAAVGGTAPVRDGQWYYEVRCVDGVPELGWAPAGTAKSPSASSTLPRGWCTGDLRAGDFADARGSVSAGRRTPVQDGDIVGCLLDLAHGHVSFTHNGSPASGAPTLATTGSSAMASTEGWVPVIRMGSSERCVLVLETGAFCAALPAEARGYAAAACDTPAVRAALGALFDGCAAPGADVCDGEELLALFRAAGSTSDTDPRALALLWLLDEKPRAWAAHRAAFVAAFAARGCRSASDVARVVDSEMRRALGSGSSGSSGSSARGPAWASFYDFVFHLLAGTARSIGAETAAAAWGILGLDGWALFAPWRAFLVRAQESAEAAAARRADAQGLGAAPAAAAGVIGLDAWRQFPDFVRAFPSRAKLSAYDPLDGAWNTLFDDFVESLEE